MGAVEEHTDPWTGLHPPVVGVGIGAGCGSQRRWSGDRIRQRITGENPPQPRKPVPQVVGSSLAQQNRHGIAKRLLLTAERMQFPILIWRAGQDEELPARLLRLPETTLFEPIRPVTTTAEQSDHNQLCVICTDRQIVIDLGRMANRLKRESTDAVLPERLLVRVEDPGQRRDV